MIAFGASPLFLALAITAFGGPEGYFSLAILAFGAFGLMVPKYYYCLGKMENKESGLLTSRRKKAHKHKLFALVTSRWPWDKRLVVPGLTGPKSLCVRLETQEI